VASSAAAALVVVGGGLASGKILAAAVAVPAGRPPITPRIGSIPLGTLRFASTSPSASMTATWERLRCTSIPA
jgi:hypothetical protein